MTARAPAARYFPAATPQCPTFVDDTAWDPLLDGAAYFAALESCLRSAAAGDTVLIAGLELDPTIDLLGRAPDHPEYQALGELLAGLARTGVDVRVLLASRVWAASASGVLDAFFGGFHEGACHADLLRAWRPAGAGADERPMTGRVVLDYSGALLGSNHQKVAILHVGGELTAFVGGIDLSPDRCDAAPHDRLRLHGARWGWHDIAVRVRGRGAEHVWDGFARRWREAMTLPPRRYLRTPTRLRLLNPDVPLDAPGPAPLARDVQRPGTRVRVLRSVSGRKLVAPRAARRASWDSVPSSGIQEIFATLSSALAAAERYIYVEDQYLEEALGGKAAFELYPYLLNAARRGVKLIFVGSGTRDPTDPGWHPRPINRNVTRDLQRKLIDHLGPSERDNVVVFRIAAVTVHAKLTLIDDRFANIGSANMFSRSMAGTDSEMSAAIVTSTNTVRDLRVAVWADHLRTPVTDELRPALEDLDLALGIWRADWSTQPADRTRWLSVGSPAGFQPAERVLQLVGP